jgi:hypothetical protein
MEHESRNPEGQRCDDDELEEIRIHPHLVSLCDLSVGTLGEILLQYRAAEYS